MDFTQLSDNMSDMQDRLKEVYTKIKAIRVTQEAGAGLVKVTMTGEKKITRLDIDPQLLQPTEQTMLQDLIAAAVNLAVDAVEEHISQHRQEASYEILGPLFSKMT